VEGVNRVGVNYIGRDEDGGLEGNGFVKGEGDREGDYRDGEGDRGGRWRWKRDDNWEGDSDGEGDEDIEGEVEGGIGRQI
jgi:hypothetical protein